MDRFIVVPACDAKKQSLPEAETFWAEDYFWCLYETDGEKPIRLVGTDGGEPEDQNLVRDWKWVPEELNKLAAEIRRLQGEHWEASDE